MVSHHRRTHPVTRQSRGITRRRETIPNIFTRIRVLTPAEINQRLLENWNFIQIETTQNIDNTPPPLLVRTSNQIYESNPPGLNIIENPPQRETPVSNEPEPSTSYAPPIEAQSPVLHTIPEDPVSLFEDYDEQETIPFIHDINFGDLSNQISSNTEPLNTEHLGDLYEPIAEQTQESATQSTEEPSLSQLLWEILSDTDYELTEL